MPNRSFKQNATRDSENQSNQSRTKLECQPPPCNKRVPSGYDWFLWSLPLYGPITCQCILHWFFVLKRSHDRYIDYYAIFRPCLCIFVQQSGNLAPALHYQDFHCRRFTFSVTFSMVLWRTATRAVLWTQLSISPKLKTSSFKGRTGGAEIQGGTAYIVFFAALIMYWYCWKGPTGADQIGHGTNFAELYVWVCMSWHC